MGRLRLVIHKTWLVQNPPADLDGQIEQVIQSHGMMATRVGDRLEFSGGSSARIKLLGTTLTRESDLPRAGSLERGLVAGDTGEERITLHLEERLNSAILDGSLKRRYERTFEHVVASFEAALTGGRVGSVPDAGAVPATAGSGSEQPAAPIVRPAGWWSDVPLGTVVKRCHVDGARKQDIGALVATEAGLAFTGKPKSGCRWEDLADIEVIELRNGRQVRRSVRLTTHTGETGEFWVSGLAEPKAVYVIWELLHSSSASDQ
jgi:hypothetical protein